MKAKPFSNDVTLEHEKGWRLGPCRLVSSISLHNNQIILTLDPFLAPLAVGQRAYVMVRCASVRLSVCAFIRLCVNFFFKHLLLWNYLSDFDEISKKCSCHGPLQNYLKKFDSVKNCGCHGNKTEKILKTLKIFLSETMRPTGTKFGM